MHESIYAQNHPRETVAVHVDMCNLTRVVVDKWERAIFYQHFKPLSYRYAIKHTVQCNDMKTCLTFANAAYAVSFIGKQRIHMFHMNIMHMYFRIWIWKLQSSFYNRVYMM